LLNHPFCIYSSSKAPLSTNPGDSYFTSKHGSTPHPSQSEGYALKKASFHSERVVQDILKKSITKLLLFHPLWSELSPLHLFLFPALKKQLKDKNHLP